MNTIIEKIRAEVERRKKKAEHYIEVCKVSKRPFEYWSGQKDVLELFEKEFLDTLQEQPVCEGLEEEFCAYCYDFKNPETGEELVEDECSMDMEQARMLARHFAKWGAEHRGSSEIPKEIEEAAVEYSAIGYSPFDDPYEKNQQFECSKFAFIAGAKWQKEKDERIYRDFFNERNQGDASFRDLLAYKEGHRDGMIEQKEQMMKEAVEGEVVTTNKYTSVRYLSRYGTFRYFYGIGGGFQKGDKVKLIIVKED